MLQIVVSICYKLKRHSATIVIDESRLDHNWLMPLESTNTTTIVFIIVVSLTNIIFERDLFIV
jgi:hypothetical protein